MANKKGGTGKKPAAKKPRKAVAPKKLTAEQLTDQQLQTLLFQHKRKLKPLLAAEKNAKDAVRKQYEIAKKEGITKQELELAFKLESEEGEEKVGGQVARIVRIARWMGTKLGTQMELFTKEPSAEKDFEDGKRAALNDEMRKPPAHLSQAAEQRWLMGYGAGVKQMNEVRESGFKPLSLVAGGVVGSSADAIDSLAS